MPDTYQTSQGDMWDLIALRLYNTESGMNVLLEANPQYADTVIFPAGVNLLVPEYNEPLPNTLPPWRR